MIRMTIRKKINQIFGTLRSIYAKPLYFIKAGYMHRTQVITFDDSTNTDEWQNEVYQFSRELMIKNGYSKVIDFGCGSGYKLVQNFADYDTLGIELEQAVDILQTKYPQRKWEVYNYSKRYSCDLLIMSDVLEHIEDPFVLLKNFDALFDFKTMIISTPDRNLLRSTFSFGPPKNVSHFREWSFDEFYQLISSLFDVKHHFISNKKQATQVIECIKTKRI